MQQPLLQYKKGRERERERDSVCNLFYFIAEAYCEIGSICWFAGFAYIVLYWFVKDVEVLDCVINKVASRVCSLQLCFAANGIYKLPHGVPRGAIGCRGSFQQPQVEGQRVEKFSKVQKDLRQGRERA